MIAVSSNHRARDFVTRWPTTQRLVDRFVAGETADDALGAVAATAAENLLATVDRLGEWVTERAEARGNADAYRELLGLAAQRGQAAGLDVSVKLSALGQALPAAGDKVAYDNAAAVCELAAAVGATVTLDMEDHTTTEATLLTHELLRQDFPDVGVAIQARLRRSEADCRTLAPSGARVRLCKGAYLAPSTVAFARRDEVRVSYARCLGILMLGTAYPMVATHDSDLLELAGRLATHLGRLPAASPAVPASTSPRVSMSERPQAPPLSGSVPASQPADAVANSGGGAGPAADVVEAAHLPEARRRVLPDDLAVTTDAAVATAPGQQPRRERPASSPVPSPFGQQLSFEYQMLFGVRPAEQRRLVAGGARVRVYVPYGPSWYPYLTRRLAERPANLGLFLRAVADRT